MPKMLFDITSIMYAVLRNFIILCISLSIYSTKIQSAELTLDITSFTYSEVDTNDNFFMEDKSAPFLYSIGLRNWGDTKATSNTNSTNWSFLYTLEYSFGNVDYSSAGTGTMKKQYYKRRLEYYLSTSSKVGANDLLPYIGLGYRDLLDDSGFKTSSTNHLGYDRLSRYYYLSLIHI